MIGLPSFVSNCETWDRDVRTVCIVKNQEAALKEPDSSTVTMSLVGGLRMSICAAIAAMSRHAIRNDMSSIHASMSIDENRSFRPGERRL
jgi:hypothetical protein